MPVFNHWAELTLNSLHSEIVSKLRPWHPQSLNDINDKTIQYSLVRDCIEMYSISSDCIISVREITIFSTLLMYKGDDMWAEVLKPLSLYSTEKQDPMRIKLTSTKIKCAWTMQKCCFGDPKQPIFL